jgi:hypothetical protein
MNDRRPAVIVRCESATDVAAAVDFARENGLALAVRGGGHSVPGFGTVDGGVVADLSGMRAVRVDPEKKTARAEGGATWGGFNEPASTANSGWLRVGTGNRDGPSRVGRMMDDMRRFLLGAMLLTLLAACAGAGLSPGPTPVATGTTATAEPGATIEPDATIEPGATGTTATAEPGATIEPGATSEPNAEPTPVASVPPLDRPDLRYRLVDQLGRPLFCDPDFYPIARFDEGLLARLHLAAIRADPPTYAAIVAHVGIDPSASPTESQGLAIYREWKMLRALRLTAEGGRFGFEYIAAAGASGDTGWHVVGSIDAGGTIAVDGRDPSGPPPCPICLARGTRIATPDGERPVEDVRPGMEVWTTDGGGRRVEGRVVAVGSTQVPTSHQVVHLVLSDGRTLDASPGHRLPDGHRLGDLGPGDPLDGATVVSAALEAYAGGATFDLLPSGPTGTYWANGILLASTLERRTEPDQAMTAAGDIHQR